MLSHLILAGLIHIRSLSLLFPLPTILHFSTLSTFAIWEGDLRLLPEYKGDSGLRKLKIKESQAPSVPGLDSRGV